MTFLTFLQNNLRWLVGGMTLTLFSGAGQTYYIALYAGDIRRVFNLSHGQFGSIYMVSTLASAATLVVVGRVLDHHAVRTVALSVIALLALACLLMAHAHSLGVLVLAIYLLRLLGQGMMSHTAITAMGRWFRRERGRAVAVTSIGFHLGEGALPLAVVGLLAWFDWRLAWWLTAAALLLVALPTILVCFSRGRQPRAADETSGEIGRQWTSREVAASGSFWLLSAAVLAPAFISTSVFFHQVHIASEKGWAPTVLASSFALLSLTTVSVALLTGQFIDRFSARALLPLFLVPLGVSCLVLSVAAQPIMAALFMCLLGVSQGISSAILGAIWPELYGTRHLGSIRSLVFAGMVFSSALGPGVTGWLIDAGIAFDIQVLYMGGYCLLAMTVLIPLSRRLETPAAAQA